MDLCKTYFAANNREPCDRCGGIDHKRHHASYWGQNLCHDCYFKHKPCTQLYCGDMGYPPYFF